MACPRLISVLTNITVEPIGLFVFLALNFFRTASIIFFLTATCHQMFDNNTDVNCRNLSSNGDAQDAVQRVAINWSTLMIIVSIIPGSIVGNLLFGSWGDTVGRRNNIVIGCIGFGIIISGTEFLGIFPYIPLWYMLPVAAVCGFSGMVGSISQSCFAFIADTSVNPNFLTHRMAMYSASTSTANIIAGVIGWQVADRIPMKYYNVMAIISILLAIIYTLIRIPQIHPVEMKRRSMEKAAKNSAEVFPIKDPGGTEGTKAKYGSQQQEKSCSKVMVEILILLRDGFRAYLKPRRGHRRLYLIMAALTYVFYLACLVELHNSVTAFFVYRRPISWTPGQLQQWRLVEGGITLFGKLAGVIIFKSPCLRFRDTTLILMGYASMIAEAVCIGLAKSTSMMYVAAGVALFGYMSLPAYKSFITQMVAPHEVGKILAVFGIAQEIGVLVSMALFTGVYQATVDTAPGTVFLMAGGILGICMLFMVVVHVMSKIEHNREQKEDKLNKELEDKKKGTFKKL